MQRFSAERVSWEEAHDEVPNRFSFNVENMLPICIQEELEEESQVFPYNMATFQWLFIQFNIIYRNGINNKRIGNKDE